jgi:hypothetical protein
MNASQDKPSIGFVSQADFASVVMQSGKPVLAVFMVPWVPGLGGEVVSACDGRVEVVRSNAEDNPGRTPLIGMKTVMRGSRRRQRSFVPIAPFEFERFVVSVRRSARHRRPPLGIVLSRGATGFHPVALSSRHSSLRSQSYERSARRVRLRNETKRPMLVASVASAVASFLA